MSIASAPPLPPAETPLQRLITCCICEELYDIQRHQPKMLPCQHTVCLGCLKDIISTITQGGETLDCPLCRRVTDIPDSGASGFPPNMTMMHIIIDKIKVSENCSKSVHYNEGSGNGSDVPTASSDKIKKKIRIKKLASAHLMAFDFMDMNSMGEVVLASNDHSFIKMKLHRNKYRVFPQESEGADEASKYGELTSVQYSNDDQLIFQTCTHIAYVKSNAEADDGKTHVPYSSGTLLHVHNKSKFWSSGYQYQWLIYSNKTSSGFAVRVYTIQEDKHFTLVLTASRPVIAASRRHFTILDSDNAVFWLFAGNKGWLRSDQQALDQVVLSPAPAQITSSALLGNYLIVTETWNFITAYNLTTGERGATLGKEELGIERGQHIQRIWITADSVLHVVYGRGEQRFLASYTIQI